MLQQEDGTVDVFKKDVPGWTLVSTKEYEEFIHDKLKPTTRGVFVHARGASQGSPRENNNNHPMFAGKSAAIHNGVIRNDDVLFRELKLDRKAETDSDIIRAIVDEWGITEKAVEKFNRMSGSGAICCIHPKYPDKVLLGRSGNPLVLASNKDFLFFSSEKETLHKACRPWIQRFGIWFQANKPDVDFSVMADNTAWIVGKNGLEWHGKMQVSMGSYKEPWRKTYEEYTERSKKWDEKAKTTISCNDKTRNSREEPRQKPALCAKCKMKWVIPFDGIHSNFICDPKKGGCGTHLHDPGVKVMVN